MNPKIAGRFLLFFMTGCLIFSAALPAQAAEIEKDAFEASLISLQARFRDGEYWNAYNPCGYEGTGPIICPDKECKKRGHCYDTENKRGCPCLCGAFEYDGYTAYQCLGFAFKMASAVFGGNPADWPAPVSGSELSPGDILYGDLSALSPHASFHAIFITGISDQTVTYADCNTGKPCRVSWNKTAPLSSAVAAVKAGATVYHAPNNRVLPEAETPVTPGQTGDINGDGKITSTDAVLLSRHLAKWKVEMIESAADIDHNGSLDATDAVLLSRFLAKWDISYL